MFVQVEERLAWWPGVTEEGKKTMTHVRDYNELLRTLQVSKNETDLLWLTSFIKE